jgi:hypothetical protein
MGAILTSYWIIVFFFHLLIKFMLHTDEETYIKIQDLVINNNFDILVHNIDVCYVLKWNSFLKVITYWKKTFHHYELDGNLWSLPIFCFYKL